MLPLVYMLYKTKDFTLYVFAPLTTVISLGLICQINNFKIIDRNAFYGIITGGIIRAMCGLFFGIIAYLIFIRLTQWKANNAGRVFLTLAEIWLYFVLLTTLFIIRNTQAIISVLLVLPIKLAISFSGYSYIVELFKFKWMWKISPISLTIYLNH